MADSWRRYERHIPRRKASNASFSVKEMPSSLKISTDTSVLIRARLTLVFFRRCHDEKIPDGGVVLVAEILESCLIRGWQHQPRVVEVLEEVGISEFKILQAAPEVKPETRCAVTVRPCVYLRIAPLTSCTDGKYFCMCHPVHSKPGQCPVLWVRQLIVCTHGATIDMDTAYTTFVDSVPSGASEHIYSSGCLFIDGAAGLIIF